MNSAVVVHRAILYHTMFILCNFGEWLLTILHNVYTLYCIFICYCHDTSSPYNIYAKLASI